MEITICKINTTISYTHARLLARVVVHTTHKCNSISRFMFYLIITFNLLSNYPCSSINSLKVDIDTMICANVYIINMLSYRWFSKPHVSSSIDTSITNPLISSTFSNIINKSGRLNRIKTKNFGFACLKYIQGLQNLIQKSLYKILKNLKN